MVLLEWWLSHPRALFGLVALAVAMVIFVVSLCIMTIPPKS